MKKSKLTFLMAITLIFSLFLAACSGGEKAKDPKPSGDDGKKTEKPAEPQVLNLTEVAELPSLDVSKAEDAASFQVLNNVMEGLYRLDKNDKPIPGVAESHEVSEDGKVFTFKIRKDAKWSNGEPVTANDFVYSYKRTLDKDSAGTYQYIMGDIKNVNKIINPEDPMYGKVDELGVVAKDDHTLEITLENPVPYFVGLTSFATFYPQNQKFVESQGDKYALEANTLVYNGPFVLAEWKHEESWKMTKNPEYWDAKNVKLDEINVNVVKDTGTDLNLYNTNQNDLVGLTSEYVDQYKDNPEFKTETEATLWYLKMNQKNPVFKNVNVRKAFSQAIDKESMVKVILNNGSKAANYFVPQDFANLEGEDFRAPKKEGFHAFDAAKAKSDWETGLKELKKDKVNVEFLVGDSEASQKLAQYIAAQLEKNLPGLKVTINPQPFKNRLALENKGQYDFELAGWGPDYQDPMTFLDMYVTGGGNNRMEYSNPKYDELIKTAKTDLSDLKKRWENLQEAERILLEEDAAIAPLYQKGRALLVKPYVKDVYKHGFGADYSYKWAYIEGKQ